MPFDQFHVTVAGCDSMHHRLMAQWHAWLHAFASTAPAGSVSMIHDQRDGGRTGAAIGTTAVVFLLAIGHSLSPRSLQKAFDYWASMPDHKPRWFLLVDDDTLVLPHNLHLQVAMRLERAARSIPHGRILAGDALNWCRHVIDGLAAGDCGTTQRTPHISGGAGLVFSRPLVHSLAAEHRLIPKGTARLRKNKTECPADVEVSSERSAHVQSHLELSSGTRGHVATGGMVARDGSSPHTSATTPAALPAAHRRACGLENMPKHDLLLSTLLGKSRTTWSGWQLTPPPTSLPLAQLVNLPDFLQYYGGEDVCSLATVHLNLGWRDVQIEPRDSHGGGATSAMWRHVADLSHRAAARSWWNMTQGCPT